jgi:hypothetical protein
VYQGSLNFIIYFYFPILKELIVYTLRKSASSWSLTRILFYIQQVFGVFHKQMFDIRVLGEQSIDC